MTLTVSAPAIFWTTGLLLWAFAVVHVLVSELLCDKERTDTKATFLKVIALCMMALVALELGRSV